MSKNAKIDKINYFLFFIFITLLIIAILQSFLESFYIKEILGRGLVPQAYDFLGINSYLSPLTKVSLLIVGIVFGYFLGQHNWKKILQENIDTSERSIVGTDKDIRK